MPTTTDIGKPTRRTIEALFKEMLSNSRWQDAESAKVYAQMKLLEEQLKATAKYKRLRAMYNKLRDKENRLEQYKAERVRAVRTRYLAEGLTLTVQKLVNELVKAFCS